MKTSDTVADETARQENLKERVDEWMSSMISKMSMAEDTTKDNVVNGDTNVGLNNSGRSSPDPDSIGKGNRNVFCNHQMALGSNFRNLVKWQQDLKILSNSNKIFKNLVKRHQNF